MNVAHHTLTSGATLTLTTTPPTGKLRRRAHHTLTGPLPAGTPTPEDAQITATGDPATVTATLTGTNPDTLLACWIELTGDPALDTTNPHAVTRAWLAANATDLGFPPPPHVNSDDLAAWLARRLGYGTPENLNASPTWKPHLHRTTTGLPLWPRILPADPAVTATINKALIVHDVTGTDTPGTGLVAIARTGRLTPTGTPHDNQGLDGTVWNHAGIRWPVFPVTMVWRQPLALLGWCGWHAHMTDPTRPTGPFTTEPRTDWKASAVRDLHALAGHLEAGALPLIGHDLPVDITGPTGPTEVVVRTEEERRRVLDQFDADRITSLAGRPPGDVVRTDPTFYR